MEAAEEQQQVTTSSLYPTDRTWSIEIIWLLSRLQLTVQKAPVASSIIHAGDEWAYLFMEELGHRGTFRLCSFQFLLHLLE